MTMVCCVLCVCATGAARSSGTIAGPGEGPGENACDAGESAGLLPKGDSEGGLGWALPGDDKLCAFEQRKEMSSTVFLFSNSDAHKGMSSPWLGCIGP